MPIDEQTSTPSPFVDELKRRAISLIITVITAAVAAYLTIRDNQSTLVHKMELIENTQKIQAEQILRISSQGDTSATRINEIDKTQAVIIEQIANMREEMRRQHPEFLRR